MRRRIKGKKYCDKDERRDQIIKMGDRKRERKERWRSWGRWEKREEKEDGEISRIRKGMIFSEEDETKLLVKKENERKDKKYSNKRDENMKRMREKKIRSISVKNKWKIK